eukprot:Platyproteum_vivax@DN4834_c0_g1_i2.p1
MVELCCDSWWLSSAAVLVKLLQFLDLATAVNLLVSVKALYSLACATHLWTDMDLRLEDKLDAALKYLGRSVLTHRGGSVQSLNFEFNNKLVNESLKYIPPSILSLNINGCQTINDDGLRYISDIKTKIHTLELYWLVHISDEGLRALLHSVRNTLQHLNISGCLSITDKSGRVIAGCRHLKHLDITRCPKIEDTTVIAIGEQCPDLEVFRLYADHHLTSVAFSTLHRLKKLVVLDVCGGKIEDSELKQISANCPNLEALPHAFT